MWIVAHDTLLAYPDFKENFKIHTNASKFQLSAVFSQKGKSVAFYNIKPTDDKKRYTVIEKGFIKHGRNYKGIENYIN